VQVVKVLLAEVAGRAIVGDDEGRLFLSNPILARLLAPINEHVARYSPRRALRTRVVPDDVPIRTLRAPWLDPDSWSTTVETISLSRHAWPIGPRVWGEIAAGYSSRAREWFYQRPRVRTKRYTLLDRRGDPAYRDFPAACVAQHCYIETAYDDWTVRHNSRFVMLPNATWSGAGYNHLGVILARLHEQDELDMASPLVQINLHIPDALGIPPAGIPLTAIRPGEDYDVRINDGVPAPQNPAQA
jgi:hypothetical protein